MVRSAFQYITIHISKNKNRFVHSERFNIIRLEKFSKQAKGQSGGLNDTHIKIDLDFFSLKFYPQLMRISIRYFSKFFYDTGFNIFPNIGGYTASLLVETVEPIHVISIDANLAIGSR